MSANTKIVGRLWNINTTGFICSDTIAIQSYLICRYSTGGGLSTGAVIKERASGVPIIHARAGTGIVTTQDFGQPIPAKGLSCTTLMANTTVRVYLA